MSGHQTIRHGPEKTFLLGVLSALGCANTQTAPPAASAHAAQRMVSPAVHAPPLFNSEDALPVVLVSEQVRDKCGLPEPNDDIRLADFDEALLRPHGEELLDRIAACLRDGSLREHSVRVVAGQRPFDAQHTDLGMQRARTARDYLIKQGVAASAVRIEPRSEQGDTSDGSQSSRLERRVEIREGASE